MTSFTGMDIQGVRSLATTMNTKAGEIRSLMQQITGQLGGTQWVGPDRTRFENDWSSSYCQQLNAVAQALESAAQHATENANQQESASS